MTDTKPTWGGKREGAGSGGARPNSGPKRRYGPRFRHGEALILERETIGGGIQPPVLVTVIGVGADELELQYGDEIIVIRRELPDDRG